MYRGCSFMLETSSTGGTSFRVESTSGFAEDNNVETVFFRNVRDKSFRSCHVISLIFSFFYFSSYHPPIHTHTQKLDILTRSLPTYVCTHNIRAHILVLYLRNFYRNRNFYVRIIVVVIVVIVKID